MTTLPRGRRPETVAGGMINHTGADDPDIGGAAAPDRVDLVGRAARLSGPGAVSRRMQDRAAGSDRVDVAGAAAPNPSERCRKHDLNGEGRSSVGRVQDIAHR